MTEIRQPRRCVLCQTRKIGKKDVYGGMFVCKPCANTWVAKKVQPPTSDFCIACHREVEDAEPGIYATKLCSICMEGNEDAVSDEQLDADSYEHTIGDVQPF